MPVTNSANDQFITRLREIVEDNLSNEQFGVSDLADKVGMSRSNLLRRVSKAAGLSVSQFIRNIRLEKAAEMLREESLTVSEVSYKVGFSSPSYFIKCFRELYGYPPGSIADHPVEEENEEESAGAESNVKRKIPILAISIFFLIVIVASLIYFLKPPSPQSTQTKSIAVLPFINDSSDSSNVYIINGIMESTLNKLQGIENLRVISRTSVEKYRNARKTIPEIAKELNVAYVVEGSGQKIGEQILLNIQLIDANTDSHLWSREYSRETGNIFSLQSEIAKNIADEIKVIITPDEQRRIDKLPTENAEAYDQFLKGMELLRSADKKDIKESTVYFRKAIELDENFARAYAATAMAYYVLEINLAERQFADSINYFADQALFHDSELPQSLIAKALFYMAHNQYELAVPYFEKALQYNPNYDLVLYFMVDLYANYIPDTQKYLEYALRGLQIDPAAYDSATNSYNYLHISNAFIQSGFVDEALKYVNKSLDYMPDNLFSEYVKAYVLFAKNGDLQQLRESLKVALDKDQNRLDIAQELAKICYFQQDYNAAYKYYSQYLGIKNALKMDVYAQEDIKIAYTCMMLGKDEEAAKFLEIFKAFADQGNSVYKEMNLCAYYATTGNIDEAMSHLEQFSQQKQFHYWTVLFFPIDPVLSKLKDQRDYKKYFRKIESNFSEFHEQLEKSLSEKGLI